MLTGSSDFLTPSLDLTPTSEPTVDPVPDPTTEPTENSIHDPTSDLAQDTVLASGMDGSRMDISTFDPASSSTPGKNPRQCK